MGKKLKPRKNHRFTILVLPGRVGKTYELNVSKRKFFLLIMFLIFAGIYLAALTYTSVISNKSKKEYLESIKNKNILLEEYSQIIYSLEERNQNLLIKNKEYLEQNENMISKVEKLSNSEQRLIEVLDDQELSNNIKSVGAMSLSEYTKSIEDQIESTEELIMMVRKTAEQLKRIPSMLPAEGKITSPFGRRTHPVSGVVGKQHNGVDIGNVWGTPIYASADGVVDFSGWKNGFGYIVIIDHENGYKTYYAHNSRLLIKKGAVVVKGQKIALMGSTGVSTGTHSHFEVRYHGVPMDPMELIK